MQAMRASSALTWLCVCVAVFAGSVAGGRVSAPTPRPRAMAASSSCAGLPGTWVGYTGNVAIGDAYTLAWQVAYPPGYFTAVYVTVGGSWTLGQGILSSDNTTVAMSFDSGVSVTGKVTDACTTILWDNGSAWRKTTATPKKVLPCAPSHM